MRRSHIYRSFLVMMLNPSVGDVASRKCKKRRTCWWENVCPAANGVSVHVCVSAHMCICKCGFHE